MTTFQQNSVEYYVGTIVGESSSREFRLAVAHETIREQDIIAVDASLRAQGNVQAEPEAIRIWAKVQRIERLNPLFPSEAGHELAATRTNPFDTVLSLSREMVTAVCQVLGCEPMEGDAEGKLRHLRYPPQPASSVYRPESDDIARIVLGNLQVRKNRALDIAVLSNRPEVDVKVNGHAIVTRHLAILAMTGAGKSWTARRVIEELAAKNYPIVIFDPHGDYTGLADIPDFKGRVQRYYAQFPIFAEPAATVMAVIESLAWNLSNTQRERFGDIFNVAKTLLEFAKTSQNEVKDWLLQFVPQSKIKTYGIRPNLYFLADVAEALIVAGITDNALALNQLKNWIGIDIVLKKQESKWMEALPNRIRMAANKLWRMENISKTVSRSANPLPTDRTILVKYGNISIVALAGYTGEFQATMYSLVAEDIFDAKVRGELKLPVIFLLEEGHNFAPGKANTASEERSIGITKQISQEGRKFGVGLILISQRPSRLDETTLAMCNSYIIMRMVNPADQNFVKRVIETLGEDEARMLPDLDVGEAILSGQLINFPVLVRIKEPASKGEREEKDAFEALEEANRVMNGGRR